MQSVNGDYGYCVEYAAKRYRVGNDLFAAVAEEVGLWDEDAESMELPQTLYAGTYAQVCEHFMETPYGIADWYRTCGGGDVVESDELRALGCDVPDYYYVVVGYDDGWFDRK